MVSEIRHLTETAWQPYRSEDGLATDREIAETVHTMNGTSQAFRLIVLRWPNPQPNLFESERYGYHFFQAGFSHLYDGLRHSEMRQYLCACRRCPFTVKGSNQLLPFAAVFDRGVHQKGHQIVLPQNNASVNRDGQTRSNRVAGLPASRRGILEAKRARRAQYLWDSAGPAEAGRGCL